MELLVSPHLELEGHGGLLVFLVEEELLGAGLGVRRGEKDAEAPLEVVRRKGRKE